MADRQTGLLCPQCNQRRHGQIVNTIIYSNRIYRRRECRGCGMRYSTYERLDSDDSSQAYEAGYHAGRQSLLDLIQEELSNETIKPLHECDSGTITGRLFRSDDSGPDIS